MAGGVSPYRVLLCVDETDKCEHAFDFYNSCLHHPAYELLVLHISDCVLVPAINFSGGGMPLSDEQIESKVLKIRAKNREIETKYNDLCDHMRIKHKVLTASGDVGVGKAILDNIKRFDVAFVVMGTRGMGKMKRAILGSISDYVLHHSPVPVVICPKKSK